MIKAIIFDIDGVLITGEMFSKRLEQEYNIPLEKVLPFFKGAFGACQLGRADLKEELGKVISDWGWRGSVEELCSFWFSGDVVNQELLEQIQELRTKGIPCYIGTNQEKYRAEYLKGLFGDKLDGAFVSAEIGAKKPTPEYFKAITNKLGLKPDEVFFWDSDQKIVDGAREFGMSAELYTNLADYKSNKNII